MCCKKNEKCRLLGSLSKRRVQLSPFAEDKSLLLLAAGTLHGAPSYPETTCSFLYMDKFQNFVNMFMMFNVKDSVLRYSGIESFKEREAQSHAGS